MSRGIYTRTEKQKKQSEENLRKSGLLKTKMTLTQKEVHHLYYGKKKTLKEIGKLSGITRQRVAQLMEEWGYPRRRRGTRTGKSLFTELDEYLEHSKKTGKQSYAIFLRLVKPTMKQCENCGSKIKLYPKILKRPATSFADFKILCSACLYAPCRKGIDGIKEKRIRLRYARGEKTVALAKEYGITRGRIYHIIWKGVENGL